MVQIPVQSSIEVWVRFELPMQGFTRSETLIWPNYESNWNSDACEYFLCQIGLVIFFIQWKKNCNFLFYALEAKLGKKKWRRNTNSEIRVIGEARYFNQSLEKMLKVAWRATKGGLATQFD